MDNKPLKKKEDFDNIIRHQNNPIYLQGFADGMARGWNNCLEELNKKRYKYSKETCPKDATWFIEGGKCGWGNECRECSQNI